MKIRNGNFDEACSILILLPRFVKSLRAAVITIKLTAYLSNQGENKIQATIKADSSNRSNASMAFARKKISPIVVEKLPNCIEDFLESTSSL